MTEKLYDQDSHLFRFRASVTACEKDGERWALTLDRTAFFPEGGGQQADTGVIGPAHVLDVQEPGGEVTHYVNQPLPVGEAFACSLDAEQRLRRMQNHSGEHILSGLCHKLYGLDNVGFHMGEACMTIDFSGELSPEQLRELERRANEAVRADLPIRAWYPGPEELAVLSYRSKKELSGPVRLVEIKGVDLCACCAPHVSRTGEVGLVKLLEAERHRGGMRLTVVCGLDAWEDCCRRLEAAGAVSRALSVPRESIAAGVDRLLRERDAQKERIAALSLELARLRAEAAEVTEGNLCLFDSVLDEVAQRELVNLLSEKCGGLAAVFSGSDEEGWRYIIGSRHLDLRQRSRAINAAIQGKGGGSAEMIQGWAAAPAAVIRAAMTTIL